MTKFQPYFNQILWMNCPCNKINYSHALFKIHISMFRMWNRVNLIHAIILDLLLTTLLYYTA